VKSQAVDKTRPYFFLEWCVRNYIANENTDINKLTKMMDHSPYSETNNSSASQNLPHILWNIKVHYRVHKSLPLVPTLSQINSIQTLPWYVLNIYSNIISHLHLSSKLSLTFRLIHQNHALISFLHHTCNMPSPSHPRFDRRNNIWLGVETWSSSL
jgi:hypothetical protein